MKGEIVGANIKNENIAAKNKIAMVMKIAKGVFCLVLTLRIDTKLVK